MDFTSYVAGLDTLVPTRFGKRRYINLDNAASTPPFNSVLAAVNNFAPWYSSVHRGNGFKSRLSTESYEGARQLLGQFVGANPADYTVIFTKNTTEAINKLSYRLHLKKKDVVLISHLEHHSNDLPWRAHATVQRIRHTSQGSIDKAHFAALLRRHAGTVRLVAITGASNVTGHRPDIHWFAERAHQAGAEILIDCAQLAAHRPIRMRALDDPGHLDYIALSGHKMYAPFGTGALVGRRDTFMRGAPEYQGGGTVSLVTPTTVDWATPPDSEEAGSPNVIGAIALAEAIRTLQHIGFDAIASHEAQLTAYTFKRLRELPGVITYGSQSASGTNSRSGIIPFTIKGVPSHLVAAILGYEWGIGVRSGCFCAHPYVMSLLGLDGKGSQSMLRHAILHQRRDLMPGLVRVSFGVYNTRSDVDQLIRALQAVTERDFGDYSLEAATGAYTPAFTLSVCHATPDGQPTKV